MRIYEGQSICKGIAIGPISVYEKGQCQVIKREIDNPEVEISRFESAKKKTVQQLSAIYRKAIREVGEMDAAIFDAHTMILEDKTFNDSIYEMIQNERVNAEYAVSRTSDKIATMFNDMPDEYLKARALDIRDVSERVIKILSGKTTEIKFQVPSFILMAEDLTPSETIQMEKENILAFVTSKGSANSHSSILARSMNIPAITGITIQKEWSGKLAIVDGTTGNLILDPDEDTLEYMQHKLMSEKKASQQLYNLRGQEDVTLDGKKIRLYANIGDVNEISNVIAQDAAGIGLFRSEFLYLEKNAFPTEEEQFVAYKEVAERMQGKKVIIRTLDLGADKQADYFLLGKEENPALGYRAIRICLDQIDIFKIQLRAIFRASNYGNIAIMYPMIISVEELHKIKKIIYEVKQELSEQGIPYKDIEQGIMVETPAAAMISDLLAKEVDFLSIGTNDLTQYTLAIDRQNAKLNHIYDAKHEAIFRMLQMVIDYGHKENCWVGICGELAADESLTQRFLKMGVDELSVAPSFVLPIRKIIRNTLIEYE